MVDATLITQDIEIRLGEVDFTVGPIRINRRVDIDDFRVGKVFACMFISSVNLGMPFSHSESQFPHF